MYYDQRFRHGEVILSSLLVVLNLPLILSCLGLRRKRLLEYWNVNVRSGRCGARANVYVSCRTCKVNVRQRSTILIPVRSKRRYGSREYAEEHAKKKPSHRTVTLHANLSRRGVE